MFRIYKDSPAYYLTSVSNNRLRISQTEKLKRLVCEALDEARTSAKSITFASVRQNPVRAGLVERAEDYRWSCARCGNNTARRRDQIAWHRP